MVSGVDRFKCLRRASPTPWVLWLCEPVCCLSWCPGDGLTSWWAVPPAPFSGTAGGESGRAYGSAWWAEMPNSGPGFLRGRGPFRTTSGFISLGSVCVLGSSWFSRSQPRGGWPQPGRGAIPVQSASHPVPRRLCSSWVVLTGRFPELRSLIPVCLLSCAATSHGASVVPSLCFLSFITVSPRLTCDVFHANTRVFIFGG